MWSAGDEGALSNGERDLRVSFRRQGLFPVWDERTIEAHLEGAVSRAAGFLRGNGGQA
jgi:hypothetical protein